MSQSPVERHLAALETRIGLSAGTGLLSLVAFSGRAAQTGALSAPDNLLGVVAPTGRMKVEVAHPLWSP